MDKFPISLILEWCFAYSVTVQRFNHDRHWRFTGLKGQVEWWPSKKPRGGRLVINNKFKPKRYVADFDSLTSALEPISEGEGRYTLASVSYDRDLPGGIRANQAMTLPGTLAVKTSQSPQVGESAEKPTQLVPRCGSYPRDPMFILGERIGCGSFLPVTRPSTNWLCNCGPRHAAL